MQASSNAVKADALCLFLGSRCLLSETSLKIPEVARSLEQPQAEGTSRMMQTGTTYGLIGQNGCGKTTLLRVISERWLPTPLPWDVLLVGQHLAPAKTWSAVEDILFSSEPFSALRREQTRLEAELLNLAASAEGEVAILCANRCLAEVQRELSSWESAPQAIEKLLVSLGFRRGDAEEECDPQHLAASKSRPSAQSSMQMLSGGWRMKVELAKALWLKPKLLLLDEPTNHLDFQALQWLEEQLDIYPHTAVVVSHDVSFLHTSCQEIFWINDKKIETLPIEAISQEDLARMQRKKALDFHFKVPSEGNLQHHGLSLHGAEFRHPDLYVRAKGDIRFSCNSRAVVLGRNGSGKSTFLGMACGALQPSAGSVDRTQDCQVGYYSQQMDELEAHADESAVDFLIATRLDELHSRLGVKASAKAKAAERRGEKPRLGAAMGKRLAEAARGVLSGFGFDGDLAVSVPVGSLSGGQKARLKLAALAIRPAHILFFDEPTNHLDAEACEALANGMSAFEGGIVVVTHDDLLIYRLIQCNWAESQLLTSQSGTVALKKEFGGHCLKTLKQELRNAESEMVQNAKAHAPQLAKPGREPVAPSSPSYDKTSALPPWLAPARTRRGRREKHHTSVMPRQLLEETSSEEDLTSSSEQEPTLAKIPVLPEFRSAFVQPKPALGAESRSVPVSAPEDALPGVIILPHSESWEDIKRGCWCNQVQKDLSNLEKSIAKWLVHRDIGVLSHQKLREKIRASAAMRQLAEREGERFQPEVFASLALQSAEQDRVSRQTRAGGA